MVPSVCAPPFQSVCPRGMYIRIRARFLKVYFGSCGQVSELSFQENNQSFKNEILGRRRTSGKQNVVREGSVTYIKHLATGCMVRE